MPNRTVGSRVLEQSDPVSWPPGAFGRVDGGAWFAVTPNGELANLAGHGVTEHEDGTISVTPSILVSAPPRRGGAALYHGWLVKGTWFDA